MVLGGVGGGKKHIQVPRFVGGAWPFRSVAPAFSVSVTHLGLSLHCRTRHRRVVMARADTHAGQTHMQDCAPAVDKNYLDTGNVDEFDKSEAEL